MIRVAVIAEGYGDVAALPVLLARTGEIIGELVIATNPIRAGDWKALIAKQALPKYLELAASRGADIILIALDMDDDCPCLEADRACGIIDDWKNGRNIEVEVVFLNREFETMFLHCQDDLPGYAVANMIADPDGRRDAKGALRGIIGRRYKETQDQVQFSRIVDLRKLYARSRAYRRLCRAISGQDYADLESAF